MQEPSPCAICGGRLGRELLRITVPDRFERHVGIMPEGYVRRWVECDVCGAATNVMPGENRRRLETLAGGYYEIDLGGRSLAEKFAALMALPPERSDNAGRVRRVVAFTRGWLGRDHSEASALDIGAGSGVFLARFLDEMRDRRWSAVAVEPDPVAAEHLRTLGKFRVIESSFAPELTGCGFDLVTLNKVLEHVADPVSLLSQAASVLRRQGGVIYVEVPDKATIRYRDASDNILGALHFHLYDPVALARLLQRVGLETLSVQRFAEPSGKITVGAFAAPSGALEPLGQMGLPS